MEVDDTLQQQTLRKRLVQGIRKKGIKHEKTLEIIGKIPRHVFMDKACMDQAYYDQAFPIGAEQTISQPYTVAFQTQLLNIKKSDRVLEIGTGSGYQTAILCELSDHVYTIERQHSLHLQSKQLLSSLGYEPQCFYGDGYKGLPMHSPFNKILVTAGAPSVPEDLKQQLSISGTMVIPVGGYGKQTMTLVTRISKSQYTTEYKGNFIFVPLLKGTER
jgi:protein-L-isoaspartate(D-aspartate) O-methyltransferase